MQSSGMRHIGINVVSEVGDQRIRPIFNLLSICNVQAMKVSVSQLTTGLGVGLVRSTQKDRSRSQVIELKHKSLMSSNELIHLNLVGRGKTKICQVVALELAGQGLCNKVPVEKAPNAALARKPGRPGCDIG